jgi:hypothetical protein
MSDALTEARSLSAEYGEAFANHTPMVLHAQKRLGGTEADARRFLDAYRRQNHLAPTPPSDVTITQLNWTLRLGERPTQAAYRAFFRAELARLGSAEALASRYLPRLLPGLAASALHALMRLAYARDAGDAEEVAESLGYWAATYLPLGEGVGQKPVTTEPLGVLARVAADPTLVALTFDEGLLWHAMRKVARMPAFSPVHDWLEVRDDTLDLIARDSLLVLAHTMEFCAIHAVTGAHWLRLVLPLLKMEDQKRAIRFFWQAIASVYPKMGFPRPLTEAEADAMRVLPAPEWDEIAAAACASDDEHDVSLAYSARCEEEFRGDRLYRVVAARRLGLIPG